MGVVHVCVCGGGVLLKWILLLLGGTIDRKVLRYRGGAEGRVGCTAQGMNGQWGRQLRGWG